MMTPRIRQAAVSNEISHWTWHCRTRWQQVSAFQMIINSPPHFNSPEQSCHRNKITQRMSRFFPQKNALNIVPSCLKGLKKFFDSFNVFPVERRLRFCWIFHRIPSRVIGRHVLSSQGIQCDVMVNILHSTQVARSSIDLCKKRKRKMN